MKRVPGITQFSPILEEPEGAASDSALEDEEIHHFLGGGNN